MCCGLADRRVVVGKTKKGALITICKNCSFFSIPHFNYISKTQEVSISLLSPEFIDTFENIELSDRTDIEEFLNSIVTIDKVQKTNILIRKLNRQFFKQQKKDIKRWKWQIATIDNGDKYYNVEVEDIENDMTYWELIIKLWNKYNDEKTPVNLQKPYYRNCIEYIGSATFGTMNDVKMYLKGGRCYTKEDQERIPHFYYKVESGEEFCIMFEKAKYMQPIPRKLTQQELNNLVKFLCAKNKKYRKNGTEKSNYQSGLWIWNDQNYYYNEHSPNWFPKYKKVNENMQMPDYTKLNDDRS